MRTRLFVEEFRRLRPTYLKLEEIVSEKLQLIKESKDILLAGIEHRVKEIESLRVKISRYGEWYQSFSDLHDLFGARVICYFSDDIDKVTKIISTIFDVDYEKSSDKRETIDAESFGYLSVHYICSLKKDEGYPEELTSIKFEVQIKTMLQHTWAMVNHDLGYKSDFGVPRVVTRQLARIAGLLETADDEFVRVKDTIKEYESSIREQIINDTADNVSIDIISLKEYMEKSKKMNAFLTKLASIENSEINYISPEVYIKQLNYLDVTTIGQLQKLLNDNEDAAYEMAKESLEGSELDIISSNIALRFLCFCEICSRNFSLEQLTEYLCLSIKDKARATKQAISLKAKYTQIINKMN